MLRRLSAWDSYLPTHPASLMPGLPQLAWLLGWLCVLATLWVLARLLLSVVFTRFLHAHLSIGRIGWASLNDIEWSLVRHARGTTSAKIQKVTVQRIALTLRGRGPKDNDIRLAWLGLTIKGVKVTICLAPSRNQDGDISVEDDAAGTTSPSHRHERSPSPSSPTSPHPQPPTTTPSFANLTFSDKANMPPPSSQRPTSVLRQLAQFSYYSIRAVHDVRRRIRRLIIQSIPEAKRRTLNRNLNLALRFFRHRIVAPALTQINTIGRSCNVITIFLALEVTDFTIDVPQVKTQLNLGLFRVGGELVRRNRSYVGLWARLEQFAIIASELPADCLLPTAKTAALAGRALEMPGPLLVEAQANFDPAIGMAALYHRTETGALEPRKTILDLSFSFMRPSKSFGKDEKVNTTSTVPLADSGGQSSSIKARLNTLLEIAERVKNTLDPHPHPHLGPHLGPHLHSRELSDQQTRSSTPHSRTSSDAAPYEHENSHHTFDSSRKRPTISARRNPAAMLKSISFRVPLIKLQAKLPELGKASPTAIAASPQIHVELRLRGLAAEAVVSKTLNSDDRHLHWFGRNVPLKLAAKAGFEKFDIDAATSVSTTGSLDKSMRVLEVSPSGLHLSSSWLPPRVDALFQEQPRAQVSGDLAASTWGVSVEPTSPVAKQNTVPSEEGESDERGSGLVVLEADIGGVNGEASLEVIQGLLLIAAAHRAKRAALKQTLDEESDRQTEEGELHTSWQAYSPPILASVIELGRCGYRITGPKIPHRATFGPGEDDTELSPGFSAPSFICVQILSLAITLQTRYADIPIHRTEAQRRELKQEIKRGSIFIPNVLFRGSQSQRTSEARAKEARQRMFESPRLDEEHEEWSQSLSPTTPIDTPGLDAKLPFSDRDKARMGVPLSASFYRENDFLCFITPDDGHMPEYARRLAASHAGGQQEVLDHPFVYFLDASVTSRKVDVYLIEPLEPQSSESRSNPTSASSASFSATHTDNGTPRSRSSISQARGQRHARRHSRPLTTKRYDLLSLDSVELAAALEVLGREFSVGEHANDESAFVSSVDSQDAHGTISLIFDGIRAEASNLSVHHCISAMLHLKREQPTTHCGEETETLVNSTFLSSSLDSDPSATAVPSTASTHSPSPTPLAQLLPPNVSFSVGFTAVEVLAAGPDPKFMPGTCRGLALKVSQLTLQRYRQDRYVVNQAHAHVRAPLGLPPDVRAHAQSVFNSTGDKDQAYATLHLRGLQMNPLVDLGKIVRAKPPVNGQGRNTTADVEVETIQAWKWCSLPRDHFFAGNDEQAASLTVANSHKRDRNYKSRKKTNPACVRDFIFVDTLETRITMWARPAQRKSDSKAGSGNSGHPNGPEDASSTVKQDHVGLVIRVPSIVIRFELFQIYCCLLAISTLRSLKPAKDGDQRVKRTNPRMKPHFQLKCNVPQVHVYCTLPHKVKLYMNLRRVEVSTHKEDLQFEIESGTLAGESHICRGLWEDIVKFRKWTLLIKKDPDLSAAGDRSITLKGEGGRLRIPCKYPFSEIVDNVATFVKATKQLIHQFIKGKFSSAIEPRSEGPKHLPDIRIALGILVLEAADDPFEAKLNLVWRAGISQQAHRLRQEEIFEDKMRAVREQESIAREEQARAALHLPSDGATRYSDNVANSAHDSTAPPMLQNRPPNPSRLRERLRREHARQWTKTYRDAQAHRLRDEEAHLKRLYGNVRSNDDDLPVQLLNHHGNTPLMRVVFGKVDLKLSKPSFDIDGNGLSDYLHDVGKGVPRNTEYSLLIPFRLDWRMNEAKAHIRDYPIPLLDIPPFVDDSKTAEEDAHSWHLSTDFVIAEELADSNAIRHVSAIVVPPEASGHNAPTEGYYFRVPRTAMPIKFYALPVVTIKSDSATRLCWGNSIQPAIQDVMRVMDSLTKPPPDPSERLGFWDKIRLILHWQVQINFEGKGPLHLILKGSRDPYQVEGIGAGFSLSWHDDVKWKIGFDNPDREFFQIFSDRFVLGVPGKHIVLRLVSCACGLQYGVDLGDYDIKSFSGQMRERPSGEDHLPATITAQPKVKASQNREQKLSKVCAKFQGGVRWGLGMQFERTCRPETCNCGCEGTAFHRQCRLFDFRPHYEVRTISGLDAAGIDLSKHDSYSGFRSDFIHFSISVLANRPGSPANTLHLTPHGFDHFSAWWHLFDGTLSLPIRHGAVFESSLPPSKKFGKHCATIKYRIQLAPVYIAHTYKQEHLHDMRKGFSTVLGVKGRLESFNVDMHQREQETRTRKGDSAEVKVRLHKAFHRVEVDCKDTELRVLSARFVSSAPLDGETESEEADINDFIDMDAAGVVDPEDAEWVDDDDYLDLYTPLGKRQPNMHLLACLKTPRLTYSRYAQHNHLYGPILRSLDSASASPDASGDGHSEELDEQKTEAAKGPISKFGYEGTHTCLLDRSGDALDVQLDVMQSRVVELETELALYDTKNDLSTPELRDLETRLRAAKMAVLRFQVYRDRKASTSHMPDGAEKAAQKAEYADSLFDREHIPEFHVFEDLDKWINRFMIHNPNVVISQRIRDILLRYYYSSRDRKLFNYAMSAKAVKFIKDMAKDYRDKAKIAMQKLAEEREQGGGHEPVSSVSDQEPGVLDLLDSLIREATEARGSSTGHPGDYLLGRLLSNNPSSSTDKADVKDPMITLREQLAANERSQNSFLVSILKPQVCLCSEIGDQSSTVVIASQALQLRTCAILDIDHIDDPINAIVLHRNFARIDALQVFYPHLRGWRTGRKESLLSHANAFVPLELLAGLAASAKDLDTIVAPTNAHLTYDKNNRLRLVSRPKGSTDGRAAGCDRTVDRFNVTCDRFTVNATSTHFAAIYDVVANLILYTDPNQKIKTQQIEANLLSKDFSDTADIAANLEKQQNVLRKLGGAYHKALQSGPGLMSTSAEFDQDLMARSVTITARRDNLEMWLATLQRSQASRSSSRSTGLRLDARAQEIVWHMREGDGRPLAKVAVNGVYFRWQNRSDGGVSNSLVIRDLNALNSGVDPYFPEIISKHPYSQTVLETRFMKADIFVAVIWNTLGAVGGIEIIDHFQVHLHPIRLQMEQSMADVIKHYFFSEREKSNGDTASIMSGGSSLSSQPSSVSLTRSDSIKSKQMQLASRNRSTDSLFSTTPPPSKRPPSMTHGNLLNLPSSASSQTTPSSTRPSSIFKDTLHSPLDALVRGDENLDANDMRERARSNHTFLHVELFPTVLCLSFKGDKSTTLPDVYGLIYKSPTIIHCNRIWTYLDLLENIKKDFKSSIWSQSATLLGQLLTTARKPKNVVQQHVQQRLLGHVSERSGDRDRRRSFTSTIRSRLSSVGPEDSKVSPLRSSYVRHGVHEDDDSSDSDASGSHHIGRD